MLTRETIVAVLEHYDLGALQDCRYIHRGVAGDPWWIETATGRYFFKRRHSTRNRVQLVEAQHALVGHLRSKGFPAPAIVPTRYGTSFLEYREEVYEIHHIIPGDLCDVSKPAHFASAARTLARYHNAVHGFDHPGLHLPRERYGPNALREILDQLVEDWRARTDAPLDQLIRELEEHSRDLSARFDGFGDLPELIIHADYPFG